MDLSLTPCLPCVAEFHEECSQLKDNQCCCKVSGPSQLDNKRGGPTKDDVEVTDPGSTGRKRAAVAYPITEGMICEWANLNFAGGGYYPIIGCPGNVATNRHHGPDKNTLNNDEGNVHRICAFCHNRWHARNDSLYAEFSGSEHWKLHDSDTKATAEQIVESEVYWATSQAKRVSKDVDH